MDSAATASLPVLELQSIRIQTHSTQCDEDEITHVRVALRDDLEPTAAAPVSAVNEDHPHPPPPSRRHRSSRLLHEQSLDADQEAFEGTSGVDSVLLPASARAASATVAAAPVAPAPPSQPLAPAPTAVASVNTHLMLQSFPAFFSLSLTAPNYPQGSQQEQQQLASLPSDCLFCILLHLDGASLAALSRCSTALCSLVEGEDSAPVWRGVARADVTRLFSHERAALAFAEPQTPVDDEDASLVPQIRRAQQQQAAMDPRTQYLLRLKQRRMTLQGASIELQRLRMKLAQIREADSVYVRRQLRIEAAFLLAFPTMMLVASILLLCSSAGVLPRRDAAWIVLLPVWLLLLCLPLLGLAMHRLRVRFLARKRQERADAAAAPPTVGATPSTSTRGRSQAAQQQQNQLQLPQAAANAAGAVPASPSSSSSAATAASAAAARTRSRAAAEAALARERRNNRFLAGAARAAEARGAGGRISAATGPSASASAVASNALIAQAHDGLLARLLESHFDTPAHCAVNLARIGAIAAATVLLAVKLSAPLESAASDLPYLVVFAPLYALAAYALLHPLLPAACAASDESSRAEFAGTTAAFAKRHAIQCGQWILAPLLTLLLLGLHLDRIGSVSHLSVALAPLWVWQGAACLLLLVWAMRFGAGVTAGFEIAPVAVAANLSPASVSSSVSVQMAAAPALSQPPQQMQMQMQMQAPMIAALPPPALVMEDGRGAAAAGIAPAPAPSCLPRLFAVCCSPLLRLRFRTRRHRDQRNVRLALTLVAVAMVVGCLVTFEALLCVESIAPMALRMIPLVAAWSIGSGLCVASVMRMREQLAEAEYARLNAETQARMVRV